MSARNRELISLIPVALLITGGFAAVFSAQGAKVDNVSLTFGLYFLAVCFATHIVIRIRLPYADPYLFPLVALLAAVGLVMLYRIDESYASKQATLFLVGLGFFLLTIIFLKDYHVLERYRYIIAVAGIGLLLSPRVLVDHEVVARTGAYINANLGPIDFQPSEFGKLAIIIFLASYLREKREVLIVGARRVLGVTLPPLKHFGPLLVVWGLAMLMLFVVRDLGASLMFFGAFLALLYVATSRLSFVIVGLLLFLLGAWVMVHALPHIGDRVDIWLDPFQHAKSDGYQLVQSMFAQADGGLFGQGIGGSLLTPPDSSTPLVPEVQTDFIYALIVDELGLFGGCALVLTYALIAARGFKIAILAQDGFSKLLATGLTTVFALQAFVIVGGVTRVIPLTGVTLPFVSFGGSSVLANMILLALLLLISNKARAPKRAEAT